MDYSKTTYIRWAKEVERRIDKEMKAYWRLAKINGSASSRWVRLKRADKYVRKLEYFRKKIYTLSAL